MKVVRATNLPLWWGPFEGLVFQANIKVSAGSKLIMKLLVFKNKTKLQQFWKNDLSHSKNLGRYCVEAVNQLATECIDFNGEKETCRSEVDKRFFCVMGLCLGNLSMEIICHESVHAGLAYARRVGKMSPFKNGMDMEEEYICYPAGRIAGEINRILHENNLY